MNVLIVTGMSGAGKKTAEHALEDYGYYCVDNMPLSLIQSFFEFYGKNQNRNENVALTLDIRGGIDSGRLQETVDAIRAVDPQAACRILYLDASDQTLLSRYKESRHVHPLTRALGLSLPEALRQEREIFSRIEGMADFRIDTTDLRPPQLKDKLSDLLEITSEDAFAVTCTSFGYKFGTPNDLDMLFDVRCFPNPFYVPELKEHTGLEECVRGYVFSFDETNRFMTMLRDMIVYLIPLYRKEGKVSLNIGIGCTGGRHRSVVIAQALADLLGKTDLCGVKVVHRDINK